MFQSLFKKKSGTADFNKSQQEYDQYCRELERTLSALEAALHVSDDPEEIAMMAMKTACDFYQADWAGFLEADMDLGLWSPAWWYNTAPNDQTMDYLNEFESAEFLHRWVVAMRENNAIIISSTKPSFRSVLTLSSNRYISILKPFASCLQVTVSLQ